MQVSPDRYLQSPLSVGLVFVNNLVAVAFRYLKGAQHGAMSGIQQGSDLSCFRTAFNPGQMSGNGMQVFPYR